MKAYTFRSSPICILSLQHFVHVFVFVCFKKPWKHEFFAAFITVNFLSWQGVLCVFFLWFAANSRSSSPTSRISYLTHTQKDPMTPRSMRRSGAARSQGASREGSPNRVHMQPGRFFIWWKWMECVGGVNFQAPRLTQYFVTGKLIFVMHFKIWKSIRWLCQLFFHRFSINYFCCNWGIIFSISSTYWVWFWFIIGL